MALELAYDSDLAYQLALILLDGDSEADSGDPMNPRFLAAGELE